MTSLKLLREIRKMERIAGGARGKKPPKPIENWNIYKGDLVQLLSGNDKGKQGRVQAIDREINELYVTGLNTKLVEERKDKMRMFDGHLEQEQPLHYSNVALVDPEDGKPCRMKFAYTSTGQRVRVSTKSNRIIPIPVQEKTDYLELIKPEGTSNTAPKDATKQTYIPTLTMFEDEISVQYGLMAPPEEDSPSEESLATSETGSAKKPLWKRVFSK